MNYKPLEIKDVVLITPNIFSDDRGYFYESFKLSEFEEKIGKEFSFVQHNQSKSQNNVIRGLHFQAPPYEQGKLVRVVAGKVLDVAVDLRKNSKTYGKHVSAILSAENHNQLWVPPGFAHGFITLEENTIFSYMCTGVYNSEAEGCLKYNDPELQIDWINQNPTISEKDDVAPLLKDLESPF
jgi:dTDP-4-dehydrorhamnose 3,5-epimerase